jgi:hypothetical protein
VNGLAFSDLAPGHERVVVRAVLGEEVRRGRVVRDLDGYRLVREALPADVLAALITIAPPDLDHSRSVRRARPSTRPSGELARAWS